MLGVFECTEIKQKEAKLNSPLVEKKLSALDFIMSVYPIKADTQITPKNAKLIFNRIIKVLNLCVEAIHKFHAGDLKAFDAHVGETACQIRACATLVMWESARKNKFKEIFKDEKIINNILNTIEKLVLKKFCKGESFFTFQTIFENNTQFQLSSYLVYLLSCYLLSKYAWYDNEGISQYVNCDLMCRSLSESRRFIKQLSHHLQLEISNWSCEFIENLSFYLTQDESYFTQIKNLVVEGDENRKIIPAFISGYLIHQYLLKEKKIILIKFLMPEQEVISLYLKSDGKEFKQVRGNGNRLGPCYVVYGTSSDISQLPNSKVKNLVYFLKKLECLNYNFAIHRQYPGLKLSHLENQVTRNKINFHLFPERDRKFFQECYQKAKTLGCSKDNNFLFLVKHVYANVESY